MLSSKYIFAVLLSAIIPVLSFAGKPGGKEQAYSSVATTNLGNIKFGQLKEFFEYNSEADSSKTKKDSTQPSSPRDGKYLILSYGSNPANPLKLGYFTLSANTYKYFDLENKLLGEGAYVYDVTEKQIKWQSGPFKAIGWSGDFSIEGNGKTHIIRLKNNTVGTNSSE